MADGPSTSNGAKLSCDPEECEEQLQLMLILHLCVCEGRDREDQELKHLIEYTVKDIFFNHMKDCRACLPIYQANKDKINSVKYLNENSKTFREILSLICQQF